MFSTLAALVLLSFLLLMGLILLVWSLISFGTGPRAVSMPWGRASGQRSEAVNPFVKKDNASSELAPDHISRGQIRTVKKPVSDVTLAEIKAITEDKVEKDTKTTTYQQMVKRAKNPTQPLPKASTPVPPGRDPKSTQVPITQNQPNNDHLRGAHAKKTLVDQTLVDQTRVDQVIESPEQEILKPSLPSIPQPANAQPIVSQPTVTQLEKSKEVPAFIKVDELKNLPPVSMRPDITHSSDDTPVTKLPSKSLLEKPVPEKPVAGVQPTLSEVAPEKKLWPAPLAPMVPKPALDSPKSIMPQPYKPAEMGDFLKPEAVPKAKSRDMGKKTEDPFENFSKDKKDDTLF